MSNETAGEMVDAAQAAHPGSIYCQGLRITYLGEVTLETPPDGIYPVLSEAGDSSMGYMRHHAIVVSSWKQELIEQAHALAVELGMSVTNITDEVTNGYRSFLVAPDGSKEGWDTSDQSDEKRAKLVEWMDSQRYEDTSTSLDWVVVQFSDDEMESRIVLDSDQKCRDYWAAQDGLT